jgi:hypothetical protein
VDGCLDCRHIREQGDRFAGHLLHQVLIRVTAEAFLVAGFRRGGCPCERDHDGKADRQYRQAHHRQGSSHGTRILPAIPTAVPIPILGAKSMTLLFGVASPYV